MARKNLNNHFDYTLQGKPIALKATHLKTLAKNVLQRGSDWEKSCFSNIKKHLKKEYSHFQTERCAFCRNFVEPEGYWEDLEHIVAKSKRPKWMFHLNNLVVTCKPCNGLKRTAVTLAVAYSRKQIFPTLSNAFITFNPHFDTWSDHFEIVDEIFLKAKTAIKGANTIDKYKLYRSQVCINLSREYGVSKTHLRKNAKLVTNKIAVTKPNTKEDKELNKALKYFERKIS